MDVGSSTIVIREASFPEDSASVASLLDDYLRQTEAEKADHGLLPQDEALPERYAREISNPAVSLKGMRVLVAASDDVDCGIVVVSTTDAGVSEIKRFWTTPSTRGRGVGTALIGEALSGAARPVRLSVWDWRVPAIRMYEGLGFSAVASWDHRAKLLCLELA